MSLRAIATRQTKVAMRAPAVIARTYVPDVRPEGTTASSKGFSQREQAEEGQYIRKKELERLKQAQDKVKQAQQELDEQQKKVDQSK